MYRLFYRKGGNAGFNSDISNWNTSNITSMKDMFRETQFNHPLNDWDVSKVIDFDAMFKNNRAFNQELNKWRFSTTQDVKMTGTFQYSDFNKDISSWNTERVIKMNYMFDGNPHFNQNIRIWDMSSNQDVTNMFRNATAMLNAYAGLPDPLTPTPLYSFFTGPIDLLLQPIITTIDNPINYLVQDMSASYSDPGATAIDGYGTDLSSSVVVGGHVVDLKIIGTYVITYSATEPTYGQTATAVRIVHVVTEIPTPTCFPAGTPVQTDQGVTAIEQLVPGEHTLRGKSIIAITQTRPLQKHIICFEKDSIGKNVPSQQTLCSKEHKVLYQGEMFKARDLADMCKNVKKVAYNGETLYNVLLEKHGRMIINNMICETLHPENIAAKVAKSKNSPSKRVTA